MIPSEATGFKSDSSSTCISFQSTSFFSTHPNAKLELSQYPFEQSLKEGYKHAVHGMVWAPWSDMVIYKYDPKAAIMMHLRFDGHLGFPGGMIDEPIHGLPTDLAKQRVTEAFVRELEEELNADEDLLKITCDNYVYTGLHPTKKTFLHFYCIQTTIDVIKKLELKALSSIEFGNEVMGNVRVPLYTMDDGYRGLPAFLNNAFVANARTQLLVMCQQCGILSTDYINKSLEASLLHSNQHKASSSK